MSWSEGRSLRTRPSRARRTGRHRTDDNDKLVRVTPKVENRTRRSAICRGPVNSIGGRDSTARIGSTAPRCSARGAGKRSAMTSSQVLALAILAATLGMFVWGRWRYDVVAVFALLAVVLSGLVPVEDAFVGFSHPAVITVIAVLIISRGLLNAGVVDIVVRAIAPLKGRENLQLAAQCIVIALLSAFMNNVGALALMLPVALRNAYRDGYPPAKTLMPLAFASLLGGLVTLIGTPPNIIISTFRANNGGQQPFGMFDFTPVGLAVAVAGLAFLILLGWRLIPINRESASKDAFQIENYISEAQIDEDSKAAGLTVYELENLVDEDLVIVGIVRDGTRRLVPAGRQRLRAGDVVVFRGNAAALKSAIDAGGLTLVGDRDLGREGRRSKDIELVEAVITPQSVLLGTSPTLSRLRSVYGINVLAVAREGHAIEERLDNVRFHSGDVLLLQGPRAEMSDVLSRLGCLPLAGRDLSLDRQRRLALAGGAFARDRGGGA